MSIGLVGALLLLAIAPTADAKTEPFAMEPITFKQIAVPSSVAPAGAPVFTNDGHHLLYGTHSGDIWLTNMSGSEQNCLTCGEGPKPPVVGLDNPFPDGKRIFVGFSGILECLPSVLDCETHNYLPVDLSGSQAPGGVILPGGAATAPQFDVGQGASPKLSPDGEYLGFSNVRTDGFEEMIVAKLEKQPEKYVVTDPRVINPPGPTSAADPSIYAWSESSGLTELKTFTHGGADVTYVESGGSHSENPDLWEVNLATGKRTRLTWNADWDEDMATSRDGQTMAVWSNRTLHVWDWLGGLLPVRSFIDAPMVGAEAGLLINSVSRQSCEGPIWLLPAEGDREAKLAGEPIVSWDLGLHEPPGGGNSAINGWPIWNRQSTELALGEREQGKQLLVAQFPARTPKEPEPTVSSAVGSWAPTPQEWHPPFGFAGDVTLQGPGGGTVTIHYGGLLGATFGTFSETYENYSEDGESFVNGTKTIEVVKPNIEEVHEIAHLTMTGAHSGSTDVDLDIVGGGPSNPTPTSTGYATTTYDGTTVSGPPPWLTQPGPCPVEIPSKPRLTATASALEGGRYEIQVTASVAGVGRNEAQVDTEPVRAAVIEGAGTKAETDGEGIAHLVVPAGGPTVYKVTAGQTLEPTTISLTGPTPEAKVCKAGEVGAYPSCVTPQLIVARAKLTPKRVLVRVWVNAHGELRLTGGGLVRRNVRSVEPGSLTLSSAITKKKRKRLRNHGIIEVPMSVRFEPTGGQAIKRHLALSIQLRGLRAAGRHGPHR
ncbi:MAG: hypothetical protein JST53_08365 [Actinobacteria bacterium]|nr:hypothetical protein [Actinomycetota bacterium]